MVELGQRLSASLVIVALVLAAIYYSHVPGFEPLFVLIAALIIAGSLWEFYRIGKAKGHAPLIAVGVTASVLYTFSTRLDSHLAPQAVLFGTLLASFCCYLKRGSAPYANIGTTLFGIAYLTIPLTCMVQINFMPEGQWWLLYLLLVAKLTDTACYFTGKKWGKQKLCPYISPGKTLEGALGGTLAGIAASFALYWFVPALSLGWIESIILGAAISITGQFGDLTESLLKRDVGVKDSNTLPGLGGILDIVDSLIFTAPLLYLYLKEFYL